MTRIQKLLFLKLSGAIGGAWATIKGIIAHFTDGTANPLRSLKASIDPVQDLHGQSSPYPAGGGKNLFAFPYGDDRTSIVGVTVKVNSDGSITLNGTTTGVLYFNFGTTTVNNNLFKAGTYTLSGGDTSSSHFRIVVVKNNAYFTATGNKTITFTLEEDSNLYFYATTSAGQTFNNETYYPQVELGDQATSFAPYSNICPITGHTGVNVVRTGVNLLEPLDATNAIKFNGSALVATNVTNGISVQGQTGGSAHAVGFILGDADKYIGRTLTFSVTVSAQGALPRANIITCDEDFNNRSGLGYRDTSGSLTFTVPQSASGKKLGLSLFSTTGTDSTSAISTYTLMQLELGSPATDYEAYTGQTYSVQFPALGANQWNEEWESGALDTATGQAITDSGCFRAKNYIPLLPNTAYYIYRDDKYSARPRLCLYDADKNFISSPTSDNTTITTPANCYYAKFYIRTSPTTYSGGIAINYPSTATTYEPYTNTVYSGTLDVVSGELVVDKKMVVYNNDFNWQENGSYGYYVSVAPMYASDVVLVSNYLVGLAPGSGATLSNWSCRLNGTKINLLVKPDMAIYDTLAKWKAYLSENNLEVLFGLATPITYQLTPTEVDSLLGVNNIWNSAGETEVTYKKA